MSCTVSMLKYFLTTAGSSLKCVFLVTPVGVALIKMEGLGDLVKFHSFPAGIKHISVGSEFTST